MIVEALARWRHLGACDSRNARRRRGSRELPLVEEAAEAGCGAIVRSDGRTLGRILFADAPGDAARCSHGEVVAAIDGAGSAQLEEPLAVDKRVGEPERSTSLSTICGINRRGVGCARVAIGRAFMKNDDRALLTASSGE